LTLCYCAATVGVVLSNDPDAHIDCIGETLCEMELGSCRIGLARYRGDIVLVYLLLYVQDLLEWLLRTKLCSSL
jgi:hypothetical protein